MAGRRYHRGRLMRASGNISRYAVGLYRVSTAEQGNSGLGLEAQQASVRAFIAAQGWTLVAEHSDIASGKDDRRIPALVLDRAEQSRYFDAQIGESERTFTVGTVDLTYI
jgi:hypothetical protein